MLYVYVLAAIQFVLFHYHTYTRLDESIRDSLRACFFAMADCLTDRQFFAPMFKY